MTEHFKLTLHREITEMPITATYGEIEGAGYMASQLSYNRVVVEVLYYLEATVNRNSPRKRRSVSELTLMGCRHFGQAALGGHLFEMPISRKRGPIKLWDGLLSPGIGKSYVTFRYELLPRRF
jgi:hypothetical protein